MRAYLLAAIAGLVLLGPAFAFSEIAEALQNPLLKRTAEDFDHPQIVYDQKLGRGGGIMINELTGGASCRQHQPEEAARELQEERQVK